MYAYAGLEELLPQDLSGGAGASRKPLRRSKARNQARLKTCRKRYLTAVDRCQVEPHVKAALREYGGYGEGPSRGRPAAPFRGFNEPWRDVHRMLRASKMGLSGGQEPSTQELKAVQNEMVDGFHGLLEEEFAAVWADIDEISEAASRNADSAPKIESLSGGEEGPGEFPAGMSEDEAAMTIRGGGSAVFWPDDPRLRGGGKPSAAARPVEELLTADVGTMSKEELEVVRDELLKRIDSLITDMRNIRIRAAREDANNRVLTMQSKLAEVLQALEPRSIFRTLMGKAAGLLGRLAKAAGSGIWSVLSWAGNKTMALLNKFVDFLKFLRAVKRKLVDVVRKLMNTMRMRQMTAWLVGAFLQGLCATIKRRAILDDKEPGHPEGPDEVSWTYGAIKHYIFSAFKGTWEAVSGFFAQLVSGMLGVLKLVPYLAPYIDSIQDVMIAMSSAVMESSMQNALMRLLFKPTGASGPTILMLHRVFRTCGASVTPPPPQPPAPNNSGPMSWNAYGAPPQQAQGFTPWTPGQPPPPPQQAQGFTPWTVGQLPAGPRGTADPRASVFDAIAQQEAAARQRAERMRQQQEEFRRQREAEATYRMPQSRWDEVANRMENGWSSADPAAGLFGGIAHDVDVL